MVDNTQLKANRAFKKNDDEPADNEPSSIEFDKEKFVEKIRKYSCLWDINSKAYRNRSIKPTSWGKITVVFNKDGIKCMIAPFFVLFLLTFLP